MPAASAAGVLPPAIELTDAPLTVGRSNKPADVDVMIKPPVDPAFVSRKHARFERRDTGEFILTALGTNGLFINGVQVAKGASRALHDGDLVRFSIHESSTYRAASGFGPSARPVSAGGLLARRSVPVAEEPADDLAAAGARPGMLHRFGGRGPGVKRRRGLAGGGVDASGGGKAAEAAVRLQARARDVDGPRLRRTQSAAPTRRRVGGSAGDGDDFPPGDYDAPAIDDEDVDLEYEAVFEALPPARRRRVDSPGGGAAGGGKVEEGKDADADTGDIGGAGAASLDGPEAAAAAAAGDDEGGSGGGGGAGAGAGAGGDPGPWTGAVEDDEEWQEFACAICLELAVDPHTGEGCGQHMFCGECIEGVLAAPSPTCPMCRQKLTSATQCVLALRNSIDRYARRLEPGSSGRTTYEARSKKWHDGSEERRAAKERAKQQQAAFGAPSRLAESLAILEGLQRRLAQSASRRRQPAPRPPVAPPPRAPSGEELARRIRERMAAAAARADVVDLVSSSEDERGGVVDGEPPSSSSSSDEEEEEAKEPSGAAGGESESSDSDGASESSASSGAFVLDTSARSEDEEDDEEEEEDEEEEDEEEEPSDDDRW